jgi:uncharacterized protein (UPF0261 family)
MEKSVYAMATMDTKGDELCFVTDCIRKTGLDVVLVDLSTRGHSDLANISARTVAGAHSRGPDQVLGETDRGRALTAMSEALQNWLVTEIESGMVSGVIALGGSGGTAIVAPAMQALPIGLPKLIVSTMASGNTQPYVGHSDITMMYSVVDVAGLNSVSRRVLSNAAHAISGMVAHSTAVLADRQTVGMTMFGVTTPCVEMVRKAMEIKGMDPLVFHATGVGGRAMDITTTEVADEVVGGVMPGGPYRFDAVIQRGIPYVMSLGALDMVNFGAPHTVPERFADRHFLAHNSHVTLMRTTAAENRDIAKWIAAKVNRSTAPLEILIPELGLSMLDAKGESFYDPQANRVLFETLEQNIRQTETRRITRHNCHINDSVFAEALVAAFERLSTKQSE